MHDHRVHGYCESCSAYRPLDGGRLENHLVAVDPSAPWWLYPDQGPTALRVRLCPGSRLMPSAPPTVTTDCERADEAQTWSMANCPHNVRCWTERACKRYEAHKRRVRRSI